MRFVLNHRSRVPIYAQLVAAVRQAVARGEMKPGDQLPTVRQLAVDLRINPNTVARAYQEMERAGMIVTRQGRGTFVAAQPPPAPAAENRDRIEQLVREAVGEAAALGCPPDEFARLVAEFAGSLASDPKPR
jgi:GntR family transcriptional regulator